MEAHKKFINNLKKWDLFRVQREKTIEKYIKVKKRTAAFYQLIVLQTAQKVVYRALKNYKNKIESQTKK